jgi:NADH-quinone oxidoreductase subunit E
MSVRRLAPAHLQPASFALTAENAAFAEHLLTKYPAGRQASAVIPLMWRVQEQEGWVSEKAIEYIAGFLGMAKIRVLEVATFYTMFQLGPVGTAAHIQVCGTTPCMLRGANELKDICRSRIHHDQFHLSEDKKFSWEEVECAGACVNAPMVQVGAETYEDLTPATFNALIDSFAAGKAPRPGVQSGKRRVSEQEGGQTTLLEPALYDGSAVGSWKGAFDQRLAAAKAAKDAAAGAAAQPAPVPAPPPVAKAVEAPKAAPVDREALAKAEEADIAAKLALLPKDATADQKADAVGKRPKGLASARTGRGDKLQMIKGIGPVNESKLHSLGIFHFDQIAAWTREEIRWVGTYLSFPGRIDREDWVAQASGFASGGKA